MNKRFVQAAAFLFCVALLPFRGYSAGITYEYDRLSRLTAVNYGDEVRVTYTYDASGNRLRRIIAKSERGDVNGDGSTDLADAILVFQAVSGMNPPTIRSDYASSGADVNTNRRVGMEEATYILQKAAGVR